MGNWYSNGPQFQFQCPRVHVDHQPHPSYKQHLPHLIDSLISTYALRWGCNLDIRQSLSKRLRSVTHLNIVHTLLSTPSTPCLPPCSHVSYYRACTPVTTCLCCLVACYSLCTAHLKILGKKCCDGSRGSVTHLHIVTYCLKSFYHLYLVSHIVRSPLSSC